MVARRPMEDSIRLGRVAGIRVSAHWSLFAVGALFGWSLAVLALPRIAPGYSEVAYWLVALATTVVFFQSLLAHELAHCMTARRAGMGVGEPDPAAARARIQAGMAR